MTADILSVRDLNRATLARQRLLERAALDPLTAVRSLLALQAQEPRPVFVALWSRIAPFDRDDFKSLIETRKVVRATMMRATLHLMIARDYAALRGTMQPALTQAASMLRGRAEGLELATVLDEARAFFAERPQPFDSLRDRLQKVDPDHDVRAAAYLARLHVPLIQTPGPGPWGYSANAPFALAESFMSLPIDTVTRIDELIIRYLGTFGPASIADMQSWTGIPKLAPVFARLRPKLVTFRDEKRRELFDVPGAPLPPADTPAPVRFLPDFDNVLLGYSERSRIIAEAHRKRVITANLRVLATFLVDGFVAGTWKIERTKTAATLVVEPFESLGKGVADELASEGRKLVAFTDPDATSVAVRFEAVS